MRLKKKFGWLDSLQLRPSKLLLSACETRQSPQNKLKSKTLGSVGTHSSKPSSILEQ